MCWWKKILKLFKKKQTANNDGSSIKEQSEDDIDISSHDVSESVTPEEHSHKLLPLNITETIAINKAVLPNINNQPVYRNVKYIHNQLYVAEFENKIILYYNRGRFPLKGWFQNCINCVTPTGQLFLFKKYGMGNIHIRICSKCSNQFNKNPSSEKNIRLINDIERCIEYI